MLGVRFVRFVLGVAGLLVLGLVLLLATSGYWLPGAAPGLLRLAGVEVESSGRGAGGRLVLRGVLYGNEAADLSMGEFRAPMPLPLLWHGWRGNAGAAGEIRARGVEVRLRESSEARAEDGPPPGPEEVFDQARGWLARADRWMPPLAVEDFSLAPAGGGEAFAVPSASFREGRLEAEMDARRDAPAMEMTAELPADGPWGLRAYAAAWDLALEADLDRDGGGPRLRGEVTRGDGTATFAAAWTGDSWIPPEAGLEAAGFEIPEGIGGLPPEAGRVVVDSLKLDWDGGVYTAGGRIRGGAAGEELTLDLGFEGDPGMVLLRDFDVTGSWARLILDEPVRVDTDTLRPETSLRFSAFVDLSGQEYYPVSGEVRGTVEADIGADGRHPLRFALRGGELRASGRALRSVEVEGRLDYPELAVESLRIALPEGSVATAEGGADVEERTLSLRAAADLRAADADTLAGGATGLEGELRIEAEVSGPWERPAHRGSARAGAFRPAGMAPLALEADWEGEGTDRLTTGLRATAGGETVRVRSEWSLRKSVLTLRLVDGAWRRAERTLLALEAPAQVRLDLEKQGRWPWRGLRVGEMRLTGEGRELAVRWDPPGTAALRASGLRAGDVSAWLRAETPLPDVTLEAVSLGVEDFAPVLTAETSAKVSWRPDAKAPPVEVRLAGRLDESGADFTEIRAAYGDTPLLGGNLLLPVTLHPRIQAEAGPDSDGADEGSSGPPDGSGTGERKDRLWRIVPGGALRGSLQAEWSAGLREWIRDLGGPDIGSADLALTLGGTVREPVARLDGDFEGIRLDGEWLDGDIPEIRKLRFGLDLDAGRIRLGEGLVEMRDSGLRLTAELPYREIVPAYVAGKRPDAAEVLGQLRADVELLNWDAEVWEDRLPRVLRPVGTMTGSVGLDPGLLARGEVELEGFALRPTLNSPPVDDIHGTLRFDGRTIRVEDAGALAGGGRLSASGSVDLGDIADPGYDIRLTAGNVPVVRTADMILRSDADLAFVGGAGEEAPLLSGKLSLRNSTYLIDFDPFSPNVESGPGTRPPYFSVGQEPFSDWRCDLAVEGRDFLRVRSSVFATRLSASLRLTRTLGDPLLLGSVRTDGGQIRFPGMNMRIESAEAFITPEEPNLLQVEADAIGQNRRYVITMNASGSADDPRIEFSSTPVLTNAQIIRLLATGSLEAGGGGAIGLYLGQVLLGPGSGEDTLADRLSVEVGQEVTESGRSTVEVIYRVNDRWSLEGEYDRFDTYNLNLVRILLDR